MSLFDDHFASKNAASARAWAMDNDKNGDRKGKRHEPAAVVKYYCEDCAPKSRAQKDAEVPQLTSKQVKNLMKSAKKGLL